MVLCSFFSGWISVPESPLVLFLTIAFACGQSAVLPWPVQAGGGPVSRACKICFMGSTLPAISWHNMRVTWKQGGHERPS